MSFGTTFVDGAAEMEGEEPETSDATGADGLLTGVEPTPMLGKEDTTWERAWSGAPDPRVEAHAVNQAHAAYRNAGAGSYPYLRAMNVVITFADAARTFAYRGINALARKLDEIAERIAPSR